MKVTPLEQDTLDAIASCSNNQKACEKLGITQDALKSRLRRCSRRNKIPVKDLPGMYPFQVTTDGEGKPTSVKYKMEEGREEPINIPVREVSQLVDAEGRELLRWNKYKPNSKGAFSREEIENFFGTYEYKRLEPILAVNKHRDEDLLNMFCYGDPHIGMLSHHSETGENFDLKIACEDLVNGHSLLLNKTPMAKHAIFMEAGDLFHAEDDKQKTPGAGNKLDVDGRNAKILQYGYDTLCSMIDMTLNTHDEVTVVIVPGNHDPKLAVYTAIYLKGIYRFEPRVNILDNFNPFIYEVFGKNLFMFHHGNKPKGCFKPEELFEIMCRDERELFGACHNAYIHTGHIHHVNEQEHRNFLWRSFSSLCAPDFWHHASGYRSERACQAITYHKEYGIDSSARVTKKEIQLTRGL